MKSRLELRLSDKCKRIPTTCNLYIPLPPAKSRHYTFVDAQFLRNKKVEYPVLLFCCCNDDKFRQILFSQVQFTNQHTINMKTLLILVILLAEQKMAISSEMNKKSTATEWWKGASTSFLPSSPAAIEVAKEKQNKEEGPDHLTNGRHGILFIYFP